MPEGVRLSKEELKSRFGLSSRAVIRVGALLSRNLLLTEAVLELARPGSPVERLLLDARLADPAARADDALLAAIRADLERQGAVLEDELCVVAGEGQTVVALREEVLADRGFTRPPEGAGAIERRIDPLPAAISPHMILPDMIRQEESSGLFPPQEVGRLKLLILTGVDPGAKIEALRRLAYAPLPANEKGILFIRALTDGSPPVRREAAIALRGLGLKPEITEAIQALSVDSRESRLFAVDRLSVLFREVPAPDRAVILSVLLSVLRSETEVEIQSKIVSSLADFAGLLASDREVLRAISSLLVERLVTRYEEMHRPIRSLIEALGAVAAESVGEILWSEFERTTDPRLRSFLLQCLGKVSVTPKARARLAEQIAAILRGGADDEAELRRLANELRGLGAEAVEPLLKAVPEAEEGRRALLLRCLDDVAAEPELPGLYVNRIGRAVLQFLATARRPLRLIMLEFRCFARPELQAEIRATLAADLIGHVHEHGLDQVKDATELALRRLGFPVVEPLLKAIRATIHADEQELAARIVSQVAVTAHPGEKAEMDDLFRALEVLHSCWRKEEMPRGAMAIATGRLCTHPSIPSERVAAIAGEFEGLLGNSPHSIDLLDALAWIASSPACPIDLRMKLGMRILGYLDSRLPESVAREVPTPDGLRLVIGSETDVYTSLLPVVVEGLERVLLSPGLSVTYAERLLGRMLEQWTAVVRFQVVWGPANVIRLAEALGAFARAPQAPLHLRVRVLEALREKIMTLPIVRLLGGILAVGEESREMLRHCEEIALQLLEMSRHGDFAEAQDQSIIMGSLAQIAGRRQLCNDRKRAEPLRRKIADALLGAWDAGTPQAERHIAELLKSEAVTKTMKKKLERRMGRS